MSDRRTLEALDSIMKHASEKFESADTKDVDPYEIFTTILENNKTEGEVQTLSKPEVYSDSRSEIINGPRLGTTYGIDAGTFPRSLEFIGGAKMNVANAVFGHSGNKRDIHEHRTVTSAIYTGEKNSEYTRQKVKDKEYNHEGRTSRVIAELYHVTEPPEGSIKGWVSDVARWFSEGAHFNSYVDDLDGALFRDGPIYPIKLAHDSIYGRMNSDQVNDGWNECINDILQEYASALEKQLLSNKLVFGIAKTTSTTELIDSIYKKSEKVLDDPEEFEFPYSSDYSFVSDLLYSKEHENKITHTSWMIRPHRIWNETTPVLVFEDAVLEELHPSDLTRAFFYVRLPTKDVFRVEVPSIVLEDKNKQERELVKQYALWELAKTQDVPKAIKHADSNAKLPRQLRDQLIKKEGDHKEEHDYNKDRRWPNINYTNTR